MKSIHTRFILRTLAWLLISLVLGACGTLDIHFEMPTPAPGLDVAARDRDANDSPAGDLPTATPSSYPFEITPTPMPVDYDPWPAEPAFTPVPAGEYPAPSGLRLVFSRDGQIWLWEAGTDEPVALATLDNSIASNLKISDDGALVAFLRENGLWVVGSDGTGERQLISKEELDAPSGEDTGLALNRLEWVPGTHSLAFNTRLNLAFGLALSDDLHLLDAGTGEWSTLLPAGEGGEFYYSPDGNRIAVVTPGEISLVDADGGQREQVLTYTPVNTGSEYRFYARPFWSPNGSALRVAIPPADPFVQSAAQTTIWHIPADGTPARLLTSIDAAPLLSSDLPAFSTDLEYVAYAQIRQAQGAPPVQAEPWLEVQRLANGDRQACPYTGDLVRWAPDSQLFAFIAGRYEPRLYIGQWSGATVPGAVDAGTDVYDVLWVDAAHYLFIARSKAERGPAQGAWDLVLADTQGPSTILASMQSYPHYDFAIDPSATPLAKPIPNITPTPASAGSSLDKETAQENTLGQPVLAWERHLDDECHMLSLDAQGQASFGPCSGTRSTAPILSEVARPQDLLHFQDRYQPFKADTPVGRLTFVGYGAQAATPAESRALAEWASLVHRELQFGRSAASLGLAVALNQEGASPCSQIQIEVFGKVFATDCGPGIEPLPTVWLTSEQLEQLYTWIDKFQAFDMSWSEDTLPLRLVFSGQGTRGASEADQSEIRTWATGLYQAPKADSDRVHASTTPSPCDLSPLQVPLTIPWTPTPEMLCLERHDPESGRIARMLGYHADVSSVAPGNSVTLRWDAEGGEMVLLEIYDMASVQHAQESNATSIPIVGLYDSLPLTGSHTVVMPEDLAGGVRILFWVAARGPVGSPVVMYKRLAFAVIDLARQGS